MLDLLPLLLLAGRAIALGTQCTGAIGGGSAAPSDPYWMKNIKRQGTSPFNSDGSYKVYRNVQDPPYNAKGDGSTDDTDAINRAITDGNRCGATTCQSSTLTPALVYFPPGTYIVSAPIIPYYYTSLVGDANKRPTLKASANFNGIAIIDADVYIPGGSGSEWYVPVNNFFRSVRNFVLDTTSIPANQFGTGLHWQVGQATSLINVHVEMSQATGNQHQGIFMENGSGGFMAQLSFNGGKYGMWVSNQQFTIHDVTITNAATGIYQLWNWGFTWKNVAISNCGVGFDLNTGGLTLATQTTSSVVILDSTIHTTPIGVRTNATGNVLGGSVVLQNVGFDGSVTSGVVDTSGKVLVGGNQVINQFIQGNTYSGTGASPTFTQKTLTGPSIPSSLIDSSTGDIFFRTRPQYQKFAPSQFTSVKDNGAKGDGKTDDTKAIQAVIDAHWGCSIIYFDAGTYLVTDTIVVPTGTYVVGEFWSTILASGTKFSDASNPKAVLQVGNPGDKGQVEISDMVVSTTGGSAGAIGIEWNADGDQGAMGMWDVHVRIGGAVGTNIQVGNCPSGTSAPTSCQGAFLGFHVAATGGGYFENVWVWAADHDLDDPGQGRINAYSARGIFIDGSSSPVWLVGTAAEHHTLYQYSVVNSANIYMGFIQTETPYYQPTPAPPAPFSTRSDWDDPSFTQSGSAWALVISKSSSVFVYGAGLYSFFVSYTQDCQNTFTCQASLLSVDTDSAAIFVHNLNTIGTTFMMTVGGTHTANQGDNTNGFPSTLTLWSSTKTSPSPPTQSHPAPISCPSVYTVAKSHIDKLMKYYVAPPNDDGGGVWISSPDDAEREWTDANKWETLYNYVWATGDTKYDIFNQAALPLPDGSTAPPAGWDTFFDKSRDDALWTALTYIKVGEYKDAAGGSGADYYKFAGGIQNSVSVTWSSVCGGGVCWDGGCTYKNTVTNGLFVLVSAIMYMKTNTKSYLDDAAKTWAWLESSQMRQPNGFYADGIHLPACNIQTTLWSYNQGVVISGLAAYYVASGSKNTTLLDQAEITIDAMFTDSAISTNGILRESCDNPTEYGCTGRDVANNMIFKGLFMKHLQYYIDWANDATNARYAKYMNHIWAQYSAVFHFATNADTEAGTLWWEANAGGSVFNGYSDQAGIDAILAAAKYGGCQT